MKEIYPAIAPLLDRDSPFALATIVRSRGSTPQKAGAQAIFHADGRTDGNLGGGCLEMEARRRALNALESGKPLLFPLHLNSDFGFDDGLICGGTADVFVEPLQRNLKPIFREAARAVREGKDAGIAVVAASPRPEEIGMRAVVVSGAPPLAVASPERTQDLLDQAHKAASRSMDSASLVVVGDLTLFVEPLLRAPALVVVGAGNIGTALSRLASRLDFHVTVLDDRPAFASEARLPWAHQVFCREIPAALHEMSLPPGAFVVIVTRGHRNDGAALRECLGRSLQYLGMIGSRRKIKLIFDELVEEGVATVDELQKVHAPLGLDIGAQSVEEIALSIAAELVLVRHSGSHTPSGQPLYQRSRGSR